MDDDEWYVEYPDVPTVEFSDPGPHVIYRPDGSARVGVQAFGFARGLYEGGVLWLGSSTG